jgi:imidazolonepropionase-like amidohydrolase
MKADCHMHMILDSYDWRQAIHRHDQSPDDGFIRAMLKIWQERGFTYLRDGGDRWNAGKRARELAPEYGITYVTPLAPLCREGHYGAFIGKTYRNMKEYAELVVRQKQEGADFIKIMISGLMDFHHFGVLTEEGQDPAEIRELIHIAHEEGMAVMAHANGARTVEAAAAAGLDSVEHGAYLDMDALKAMEENGTVWVPTLSTVGNLVGEGRFPDEETTQILESALYNLSQYQGLVGCGTDAGAWAVPHGSETEAPLLARAGIGEERYLQGNAVIIKKFRRQ